MSIAQTKIKLLALFACLFPSIVLASPNLFPEQINFTPVPTIYPHDQTLYDLYPNSVMYFYGITASDALAQIVLGEFHRWPEHLQSVEFAHTLSPQNPVRRFFNPLVGITYLAIDGAIRNGSNEHQIYEVDPYIGWRWANFSWNKYINTSLSIGEGVSYDSSVPSLEKRANQNTKRFLNYLMLEATFALPTYPRLQLITRIHHRSGAFGLYHAGNTGSNVVGLGLRYLFD